MILAGVDFTSLMIWGSVMALLIDRYGRKPLMLFGAIGCGICFTLVTIGLAIGTKPTYAMSVAFIFGYHLFYVSFRPTTTQVPPLTLSGRLVPLHPVLVPVGDQLVSHAERWQLGGHGN